MYLSLQENEKTQTLGNGNIVVPVPTSVAQSQDLIIYHSKIRL